MHAPTPSTSHHATQAAAVLQAKVAQGVLSGQQHQQQQHNQPQHQQQQPHVRSCALQLFLHVSMLARAPCSLPLCLQLSLTAAMHLVLALHRSESVTVTAGRGSSSNLLLHWGQQDTKAHHRIMLPHQAPPPL